MSTELPELRRGGLHVTHQGWLEDARGNAAEFDQVASDPALVEVVTKPNGHGRVPRVMLRCKGHDSGVRVGAVLEGRVDLRFWPETSVERTGLTPAMSRRHRERDRAARGARLDVTCMECDGVTQLRPGPLLAALADAIRLRRPHIAMTKTLAAGEHQF